MSQSPPFTLPAEILDHICLLLYDTHRASLLSLSLASKHCCVLTTGWIFRHIELKVTDSCSLAKDLAELDEALNRRNAFGFVQRITISGSLRKDGNSKAKPLPSEWMLQMHDHDARKEIYGEPPSVHGWPRGSASAEELSCAWQPLVSMIKKTTHLRDFNYKSGDILPLNILQALEDSRSGCRLHMEAFYYSDPDLEARIPQGIRLARSPVLYSIKVRYTGADHNGVKDPQREAMIRTIRGIIPNLKRVAMISDLNMIVYSPTDNPRRKWKGFDSNIGPDHAAVLDHFECNEDFTLRNLTEFANTLSFAELQHLRLSNLTTDVAFRYFTHQVNFTQLHTLEVSFNKLFLSELGGGHTRPRVGLADFINSLAPLKSLDVSGFIEDETVNAILNQHGTRLRRLRLVPDGKAYFRDGLLLLPPKMTSLNPHLLHRLSSSCPYLEDLQIPVQRCKSKGEEVECYKALSECRALRNLFVELRYDKPDVMPLPFQRFPPDYIASAADTDSDAENDDDEDTAWDVALHGVGSRSPKVAHMKRVLQNCAMDENLARSIWKLIAGKKQGVALQSLKLYPVGATTFDPTRSWQRTLKDFTRNLSRAFLLEASPRDDASVIDDVQVRELGKRAREAHTIRGREADQQRVDPMDDLERLWQKAFRRVWPESKAGSVDWRDDWSSIPLQTPTEFGQDVLGSGYA